MVNLSKRLSILQPKLLDLRHGKGAHVLPSAPAPQLVHVFLRYPRRHGLKPDARTDGAHQFGTRYLPRLKYHNPKLKVDIKTDGNTHAPMKLMLDKGKSKKPTADDDEVVIKDKPESGLGLQSNTPVYSRSVTLSINSKSHWEIWQWFKRRTGAEAAPMTDADAKLKHKINKHKHQAEIDRQRSQVIGAQLQQERAALDKAKKASERLLAE
ncbi:hypothetical protein DV735_g5353, partial [Chaetothyriales sp. CBS 134920]